MAVNLLAKARAFEAKAKAAKKQLEIQLGRQIFKQCKVPAKNADGSLSTYKKTIKDSDDKPVKNADGRNKTVTKQRMRKISSVDEFNSNFDIINKKNDHQLSKKEAHAINQFCNKYHLTKTGFDAALNTIANFSQFDQHIFIKMLKGEAITNEDLDENNGSDDE